MMTSFGTAISMTPLELAALLGAIANGGTLYYLQYPRSQDEIEHFTPKVKHPLQLAPTGIEDIKTGMRGAVDFGTARRAGIRFHGADSRQDRHLHGFPELPATWAGSGRSTKWARTGWWWS